MTTYSVGISGTTYRLEIPHREVGRVVSTAFDTEDWNILVRFIEALAAYVTAQQIGYTITVTGARKAELQHPVSCMIVAIDAEYQFNLPVIGPVTDFVVERGVYNADRIVKILHCLIPHVNGPYPDMMIHMKVVNNPDQGLARGK